MKTIPKGYWACACVKRDAAGLMTQIKLNSPKRRRCPACGARRHPEAEDPREGAAARLGLTPKGEVGLFSHL